MGPSKPRRCESEENDQWDPGSPNIHVLEVVARYTSAALQGTESNLHTGHMEGLQESRTDLDSNANMVALDKNCTIIADTGKTAKVSPFAPDYESLHQVPIVDASV